MTPERKAYLAKCSEREKLLRFKIREYELDIQGEKYRLTQGARLIEPDNTKAKDRIRMYKYHLTAYRHELNRLKGMDRVVRAKEFQEVGSQGLSRCSKCGEDLSINERFCSACGRKILWEKVN